MRKVILTLSVAVSLLFTGCMSNYFSPISIQSDSDTETEESSSTQPEETEPPTQEEYLSEIDATAAQMIDDSIVAAIVALDHIYHYPDVPAESNHVAPYTDPIDLYEKHTPARQFLFNEIIKHGREYTDFTINPTDYPGDNLIVDYLTIAHDIEAFDPRLDCFYDVDLFNSNSLKACFFDPDKDANYPIAVGTSEFEEMQDKISLMDAIISRVVRKMPHGLSTYDQYYYLACVVAHHTEYSNSPRNRFNAYGSLLGGMSVCEGYSEAFLLLCKEAGLYCRLVNGYDNNGVGHQWNSIILEDQVFYVDVTWCDSGELGSLNFDSYFAMTKEKCIDCGHDFGDN